MNIWEMFLHSLKDCSLMLPLLFATYLLIELIERKTALAKSGKFLTGKASPVLGALAGSIPQCGISVMSAKLFDKGVIGIGTLFSVFIATSDEAITILLASDKRVDLIPLLIIKIIIAVF